jgi:hypothetical protein
MNWKLITQIIMGACVAVLVIWDIIADTNKVGGDTISEVTLAFAKNVPLIGIIIGIVVGHLFTSMDTPGEQLSSWGQLVMYVKSRPHISLIWGLVTGALFWYQQANFKAP